MVASLIYIIYNGLYMDKGYYHWEKYPHRIHLSTEVNKKLDQIAELYHRTRRQQVIWFINTIHSKLVNKGLLSEGLSPDLTKPSVSDDIIN